MPHLAPDKMAERAGTPLSESPFKSHPLFVLVNMAVDPVLSQSVSVGNSLFSGKNTGKTASYWPFINTHFPLKAPPGAAYHTLY